MWKVAALFVLLAAITCLVYRCVDTFDAVVTTEYQSLADANEDQLFGRGWLPDILPNSTHNIIVTNNLDINTSVGSFELNPNDLLSFKENLVPSCEVRPPPPDESSMTIRNLYIGAYSGHSCWYFFCSKVGKCTYEMPWLPGRDYAS